MVFEIILQFLSWEQNTKFQLLNLNMFIFSLCVSQMFPFLAYFFSIFPEHVYSRMSMRWMSASARLCSILWVFRSPVEGLRAPLARRMVNGVGGLRSWIVATYVSVTMFTCNSLAMFSCRQDRRTYPVAHCAMEHLGKFSPILQHWKQFT